MESGQKYEIRSKCITHDIHPCKWCNTTQEMIAMKNEVKIVKHLLFLTCLGPPRCIKLMKNGYPLFTTKNMPKNAGNDAQSRTHLINTSILISVYEYIITYIFKIIISSCVLHRFSYNVLRILTLK
jgi:hypothetical protein